VFQLIPTISEGLSPLASLNKIPDFFNTLLIIELHRSLFGFIIYGLVLTLLIILFLRVWSFRFAKERYKLEKIINERTEEMIREKDKTEKLLSNVLPKDTADELMEKGKATKKKFKMATVLFSDIQGFTKIAEQMNPEALIDELDKFFFQFDSVVGKYNIEKIKTIGDAYMCAGGIPNKNRTNPVEVVLAALEMQKYMHDLQEKSKEKGHNIWDIRIGIHTGSVIAGVVGHKKLSYDIWGDTVNTASRMESSGEAGKINISGSTYELVKDFFICEYRGRMPVKYKGDIDMYFVNGVRPELSGDDKRNPNEKFMLQLQLLRLLDLEEDLVEKMEEDKSEHLYFHNIKHTINVYTQVELLGRAHGLEDEDMLVLRTAGLMHDAGISADYENHEIAGCDMAKNILPTYNFTDSQIEKICSLIMATALPPKPGNLLEEIICDADLDYLGRIDFVPLTLEFYRELKERNLVSSFDQWRDEQIEFIKSHDFFSDIARKLRDVKRDEQVEKLRLAEFE
jgi:class 3 adenylate cyclase